MKQSIISSVLAALIGVAAVPALAQSQGGQPVTRAQVKAELASNSHFKFLGAETDGITIDFNNIADALVNFA